MLKLRLIVIFIAEKFADWNNIYNFAIELNKRNIMNHVSAYWWWRNSGLKKS